MVPSVEQATIAHWLDKWFRQRAPHIPLAGTDNYFERGALDSFDVVVLIEDAEKQFGMRFDAKDFQDRRFVTIDGLTQIIAEKPSNATA